MPKSNFIDQKCSNRPNDRVAEILANLKQNSGLQKIKCNHRPGELDADLAGAALDARESDCKIALSGAAAAIKMQSKKRLPATWLAGDCMSVKPFFRIISNF
ncbi:MAG: hypothetical protein AB1649_24565 [Chloroflexota bacterium]